MSEEERWKGDLDLFARLNSTQIMNSAGPLLLYTRDGTWPQISFLSFFKRALDTSDVAREEKLKIGSNFRKSMDIVSVNNYCHRYRPFINSGRVLGNFDAKTRIGFP